MRRLLPTILSITMLACTPDGGTATGNPLVDLKIEAYNSTLVSRKTDIQPLGIDSLTLCFKRLRFKQSEESSNPDPSADNDNLNFYLGDVTISNLGTDLKGVLLPLGTYSRVEFDLDSSCSSGKSIQLTNATGSFSTSQDITIKFEGTFTRISSGQVLGLDIQKIVSSLNSVTSDSDIRSKAEASSGQF
jgi:hypothetical protein